MRPVILYYCQAQTWAADLYRQAAREAPAAVASASPGRTLHRGKVAGRGPTAQVLEDPQHPYKQRLPGSVPRPGWKPRRLGQPGTGEERNVP